MKILLIHSYYQLKGGEDAVFEQEYNLLGNTEEVEILSFYNKSGIKGAFQFLVSIWNPIAAYNVKKKILSFQPDIVHIHNWHFGSGPIIIRTAKKMNVPVVITLHNYRLLCPSATLLANGELFIDSLRQSFPWKAVCTKVYRNSYFQTFWLALIVWFHKIMGTWKKIDRFITLTASARSLFVKSSFGIPKSRIIVKPNFILPPTLNKELAKSTAFLYVGRLSAEKGIKTLLDAINKTDFFLNIAGEGPLINSVLSACANNTRIKYLGSLNKTQVFNALQTSTALIFPSIWYEPFGLIIIEAFSSGCPVIASDIGSPTELVIPFNNGLQFKAGDPNSLADQLVFWHNLEDVAKATYSDAAIKFFNAHFTPSVNKSKLLSIYKSIIG